MNEAQVIKTAHTIGSFLGKIFGVVLIIVLFGIGILANGWIVVTATNAVFGSSLPHNAVTYGITLVTMIGFARIAYSLRKK